MFNQNKKCFRKEAEVDHGIFQIPGEGSGQTMGKRLEDTLSTRVQGQGSSVLASSFPPSEFRAWVLRRYWYSDPIVTVTNQLGLFPFLKTYRSLTFIPGVIHALRSYGSWIFSDSPRPQEHFLLCVEYLVLILISGKMMCHELQMTQIMCICSGKS